MKLSERRADAQFNTLLIEDNKVFLDGFEVKGVSEYRVEAKATELPTLTVKLFVEDTFRFRCNIPSGLLNGQ